MKSSTKTLCWCVFFVLSVKAQKSDKNKRCTTTPTLFKNIGKIVQECEADVRVLLIDDVFSFANESLPHHYDHSEEDFEYDIPEPSPYRPKLKNYLHYDTESQENEDPDEYSSHRFVIRNYRNKLKNYQFSTKQKYNQQAEEETLQTLASRLRPTVYHKPSAYADSDYQEYDSVPHESVNHKSVLQNAVHHSSFKNNAVHQENTPISYSSVQHSPSQHNPIKVNSNQQIQHVPTKGNSNKQNIQHHKNLYDSAPETPIFHQPTQTYIHSPSTFQVNLAPEPTYYHAQEEHLNSLPQTYVQPNEPLYDQSFDLRGHDMLAQVHHVQHPQPHYEQHYSPQAHVENDPHLQTHSMLSPVFHPQQQHQQQIVNPFLNQHTLLQAQPHQHQLDAHTLLSPQTLVYPQIVGQPNAILSPQLFIVPQKFKKAKKRKVIKLRVRVNKRRKSQRSHASYHYAHQNMVQKLYPVNAEQPHTEHHEPQESQQQVMFVHPRGTTHQYSRGLITKMQKQKPYTKSEKKHRVKRDSSLDLFTHQSIISKEDRWVAGCLMQCVYRRNKVLDKNGWPSLDGMIKLFSEGVQEYGYFTVTLRAVDTCMRGTFKKYNVDTNLKATTTEGCDIAFDMFDCVTDMIADYCK